MTRIELFQNFLDAAREVYDQREAKAVASLLMEDIAGITRNELIVSPDAEADVPTNLGEILQQLRRGRPIQYMTGRSDFCDLIFTVREGVLIPRPETEELVEWILRDETDARNILDIGTGSGAIAVALAAKMPLAEVCATDISEVALAVAHRNAADNRADIMFLKADILSPPEEWEGEWSREMFDLIVSNPPYIPSRDVVSMDINVRDFEPHTALFVPDNDPLLFYRAIAYNALWLLRNGGCLYFEIYEEFADEISRLLETAGFCEVEVRQDINCKNRMLRCRKK